MREVTRDRGGEKREVGREGVGNEHVWRTGGAGEGRLQRYGPRGRNRLQVLILVRSRPRGGAEASSKSIGWNRQPREDRSTI